MVKKQKEEVVKEEKPSINRSISYTTRQRILKEEQKNGD